jgi:ribosomal-protein-serine acetyltransferase
MIGMVKLTCEQADPAAAALGYALDGRFRGRGIMTKACRHLIAYGESHMRLERFCIIVDPDNAPSRAIAVRLGFQQTGLVQGGWTSASGPRDAIVYTMTAKDR